MTGLRTLNAGNRGLFTLDGTRTFLVGDRDVAIVDPGPNDPVHIASLAAAVRGATRVRILLTHGHGDHVGAASDLAVETGAEILGSGHPKARALSEGERVETDAGDLTAVLLPGHTVDHLGFWWAQTATLFAGDLLLGSGNTTWVAGYPTCVADYLQSLDRVDALGPSLILPAHGPALEQPRMDVDRFRLHRLERIEQVRTALADMPAASADELVTPVYGTQLPSAVRGYAAESIAAILDYLADAA